MLKEEQLKDRPGGSGSGGGGSSGSDSGGGYRKNYLRSVSWTDRSPRKPLPRPQSNNKTRLGAPPLPPLSISKRAIEEWPRAGSDDLGVWPQASTPGARGPPKLPQNLEIEKPDREFEFKKDKIAFFEKECSRIVDHVYLGSDAVAKNLEVLKGKGITHVLNCVGFVCPEYFKDEFGYKTLWLRDSPTEDITSILYDVFDYFEDVREQKGRVLVHCCQGVSRSTSLVIAYLMWKQKQSFDDAFQYVKSARGVTNPNMGFACQLLLCQNRTRDFRASPDSVLRMYRMAPHSPYDPLHLVPKMLSNPGVKGLDSRGAFVVHAPVAVYVWIGKDCVSVMSEKAKAAAQQVIKYEMAQGPILTIKEGEESIEFWEALSNKQVKSETIEEEEEDSPDDDDKNSTCFGLSGKKKIDFYNQDFEVFFKALEGGVVPLFPLSGSGSETCLPARENGWGKLRRKFSSGIMKEFIMSSKLSHDDSIDKLPPDRGSITVSDPPWENSSRSDSMDFSFCSSPSSSPTRIKDSISEKVFDDPLTDRLPSPAHSCSSQDSFSSYLIDSPKNNPKPLLFSPTNSDYSSSFSFSPSSSKWSDLSCLSSQTSPSGLESPHPYPPNDERNDYFDHKQTYDHIHEEGNGKGTTNPSIAKRRGSNFVPLMVLPSSGDEVSQAPKTMVRSWSFSLFDSEMDIQKNEEGDCELNREELTRDVDMIDASYEVETHVELESSSSPVS